MDERIVLRLVAILLACCFTAAHAATHIVAVNGFTSFTVNSGTRVSGIQAATVDDAGNPVAGQGVTVGFCGFFPAFGAINSSTYLISDANGILALPEWQAPYGSGSCSFSFRSADPGGFVITAQVVGPVAAVMQFQSGGVIHQVPYGGTFDDVRVVVTDASGTPIPGQTVGVINCPRGTFDGSPEHAAVLFITTDGSGVATVPRWTAPNASSGYTACVFTIFLYGFTPVPDLVFGVGFYAPTATALQYIDATHAFTVTTGGTLSSVRFATVDSNGNRVGNQRVTADTSCGTFQNSTSIVEATSDSSGLVTLPPLTVGAQATSCSINAHLPSVQGVTLGFTVEVIAPAAPPGAIATRFAMIDSSNTFYTTPGGTVTGVHFATVTDIGARVGNQAVQVTSLSGFHCGSFSGATILPLTSDANGVVSLPAHTAAMSVTNCVWKVELVAVPANYLVIYFNTGDPFATLTPSRLVVQNHVADYTVASTGVLENVEVAAIATSGAWMRQRSIQFTSMTPSCGSFAGSTLVTATTDEGGVAVMPRWTPTGQVADCVIAMDFAGTNGLTSNVQVHIAGVGVPPGPPPPPVTTASGTSPQGGTINMTIVAAAPQCSLSRASFIDPGTISPPVAPAPEGVAAPHGLIDFRVDNCGSGQSVTFNVDFPQDLPPTAQWWKYGPTMDNRTAHWYVIPSTVSGKRISFTITDGGLGDDDLMMNGSISDPGMLAIPNGLMQDLWWSGPGENGWGMSIVQHRDVLFANMFVYDANGAPTWYVMPNGSWNADHTVYTGNLYLPKGSPFYAYDGTKFDIGASVGTARLTFSGANNAGFDYTINGTTGHKDITRILFGPQSPPTDKPLGDLWWAGAVQNGWGLAVLQQYSTLFALWFTYDAAGKPTWFVMPAGSWVAKDDYQGKIYRADGPPWLGVTYDVSRHKLTEVGTFRFRVTSDGATFDYTVDGRSGSIPLSRIPF